MAKNDRTTYGCVDNKIARAWPAYYAAQQRESYFERPKQRVRERAANCYGTVDRRGTSQNEKVEKRRIEKGGRKKKSRSTLYERHFGADRILLTKAVLLGVLEQLHQVFTCLNSWDDSFWDRLNVCVEVGGAKNLERRN